MDKARKLAEYCERTLDLAGAGLGEEYFYQSLPLCVIDAVFSIGVRYESTRAVVIRYCDYYGLPRIRPHADALPEPGEQEPVPAFVRKMEEAGDDFFTNEVFRNRQRTSSRNGIRKTEAVRRFASVLQKHGIHCLQDVPRAIADPEVEREIRLIPGQRSGISFRYFCMLAGSNDFIKPDRMIQRFLAAALGEAPDLGECQRLPQEAARELKGRYPHLTPRLLDYRIWSHTRSLPRT
jgi:hypothetical protein